MLISPGNTTRHKHEIMPNQTSMPEPSQADKINHYCRDFPAKD